MARCRSVGSFVSSHDGRMVLILVHATKHARSSRASTWVVVGAAPIVLHKANCP